jgi:hypothetical protein
MYKIYNINNKKILATSLNDAFKHFNISNHINSISISDIKQTVTININKGDIDKINTEFESLYKDFKTIKCQEMKKECPEDSKLVDPILMYEEWCDVPYKEYVKNDSYFKECYRLSNLLQHFESVLIRKKNGLNNPKWPFDPITRKKIPLHRLLELYHQSESAELTIPPIFFLFLKAVYEGLIDETQGMAPEEAKGHVSTEYIKFIESFNKNVLPNDTTSDLWQENIDINEF